jgi:secondary thiamine-phosphate synthase enzyme
MDTIEVASGRREEIIDITAEVERLVARSGVQEGLCVVFVPHTTAAVTINENADPDVRADILKALRKAVPDTLDFAHGEGNSPAHVKATIVGASVTVPVALGRLKLGTWQGVQFCEFDGPRRRQVWVLVLD